MTWSEKTCDSGISKDNYKKRINKALKVAGLPSKFETGFGKLKQDLMMIVDPQQEGHSCREALANKKRLALISARQSKVFGGVC